MFYENPNCAFRITGVFYVERAGEQNISETKRTHTTIAYRVKGESRLTFRENTRIASAGSITYIPAGADYRRSSSPEALFVIHLQGYGDIGDNIEIIESAEEIKPLLQKLLLTWETGNENAYNRSVKMLYSLFETLQRMRNKEKASVPAAIKPGVELLQNRYKDASLRIADLAEICFISEVYFRNLFRRYFGETPQQALLTLRFRYVCELLCSGYYTQEEAARLAGFLDVKYFRTAFKKRFGLTPSEYKKTRISEVDTGF